VADVKKRIEEAHSHPAADQKLIYSGQKQQIFPIHVPRLTSLHLGKVLPDDKTVEACEIREKDFLVLMVSKVIQSTLYSFQEFIRVNFAAKSHTGCFHQRHRSCATSPTPSTGPTGPTSSTRPTHHH